MKARYATEREWLDAFRREQQPAAPAPIVRKHLTGLELKNTTPVVFSSPHAGVRTKRPWGLRRHGR